MAPHCSCAGHIPGRILRPLGGHMIFGGETVVAPLGVLLGTRGGEGKLPPLLA